MHSLIIRNQDQFNIPGAPVLSANAEIPAARVIHSDFSPHFTVGRLPGTWIIVALMRLFR